MMLPVNLCKDGIVADFEKELIDPTYNQMWRIEGNDLGRVMSSEGKDWLNDIGCRVDLCEVFYLAPGRKIDWHIDISGHTPVYEYTKINYVFPNVTQQRMAWGERIGTNEVPIGYNSVGSPHMKFDNSDIVLKNSISIAGPTLVNVGVPHRADNDSDVGIWYCCFIPKRGLTRISFDDAAIVFKNFIVPFM